jgi:prepilin peptidase CpaA
VFSFISTSSLVALLLAAAFSDIQTRRIPNRLILLGFITSFGIQIFFGGDGRFFSWTLGLLSGLGLFMPLYFFRAMGAGDVKLMAMVGAFLGPTSILGAALTILLAGGILALFVALWRGSLSRTITNVRSMLLHTLLKTIQGNGAHIEVNPSSAGNLPYGVAIAVGTFIHLFLAHSGHALFV